MRIFIDIDGVLAFCNVPVLAHVCNDAWKLGISNERLEQIARLEAFRALPEVEARRSQVGATRFENELAWMHVEPAVIAADIVARSAVEGVERLSEIGEVSYLTARYIAHDKRQHDATIEATYAWLCEHQFKNAFRVQFCDRIVGKVSTLITIARATDELLVLIDDSTKRIVEVIDALDERDRALLCDRLVLVAFAQPRPRYGNLRTLHMPYWNVEPVARCLVEEEQRYVTLRRTQRSA